MRILTGMVGKDVMIKIVDDKDEMQFSFMSTIEQLDETAAMFKQTAIDARKKLITPGVIN